jgi:hypothetical protein
MNGTYVNILSKDLAEQTKREAELQGLKFKDIVEKALTAYLRCQADKRRDSKYILWHVERERPAVQ